MTGHYCWSLLCWLKHNLSCSKSLVRPVQNRGTTEKKCLWVHQETETHKKWSLDQIPCPVLQHHSLPLASPQPLATLYQLIKGWIIFLWGSHLTELKEAALIQLRVPTRRLKEAVGGSAGLKYSSVITQIKCSHTKGSAAKQTAGRKQWKIRCFRLAEKWIWVRTLVLLEAGNRECTGSKTESGTTCQKSLAGCFDLSAKKQNWLFVYW